METAIRYLKTIESLMIENSRLTKELQDVANGVSPSRVITDEEADKCFSLISNVLGPTSRGTLVSEVTTLCEHFRNAVNDFANVSGKIHALEQEKNAIAQAIKGDDITEKQTALVTSIVRQRAVLEVIKTRLDRICLNLSGTELNDMRKDVERFLSGEKNE